MELSNQEKVAMLRKAKKKLFQAIELIEEAVGDDPYVQSQLITRLKVLSSGDHDFVLISLNIDDVIEKYIDKNNEIRV